MVSIAKWMLRLMAVAGMMGLMALSGLGSYHLAGLTGSAQAQDATPVREGMAPLGSDLVSVFHFDNATKQWLFYNPEFADISDLTTLESGKSYWVDVARTVRVTLNDKERNLTCVNEYCGNTIAW